jgi:hypothetical protein
VDPSTFSSLLAAYLHAVAAGNNLLKIQTIGPDALRGYMTSACDALALLTNKPCSYIDPATLEFKRPKTLPILGDIIGQRTAWKEPRPRKEPFTLAMIDSLRDYLHDQTRQHPIQKVFLTAVYAAYDWLRLGTFTGSRISEHAQTSTTKNPRTGKRYACVPDSPAAGPWANQPRLYTNRFRLLQQGLNSRGQQILPFEHGPRSYLGIASLFLF